MLIAVLVKGVDPETQGRHYSKDEKPKIIDTFDVRGRGDVNTATKVGRMYGEIIGLLEECLRVKTFSGRVTTSPPSDESRVTLEKEPSHPMNVNIKEAIL